MGIFSKAVVISHWSVCMEADRQPSQGLVQCVHARGWPFQGTSWVCAKFFTTFIHRVLYVLVTTPWGGCHFWPRYLVQDNERQNLISNQAKWVLTSHAWWLLVPPWKNTGIWLCLQFLNPCVQKQVAHLRDQDNPLLYWRGSRHFSTIHVLSGVICACLLGCGIYKCGAGPVTLTLLPHLQFIIKFLNVYYICVVHCYAIKSSWKPETNSETNFEYQSTVS